MSAKESFLYRDKKYRIFLALLKAGLWDETNANLSFDNDVDWNEIYRLAEEQSVIGLIAEGIETVQGEWLMVHGSPLVPQTVALQFVGQTLQIEQRNKTMNAFLAQLVMQLRKEDVYALLVKGQGVAQCYKKPYWRISGDIDLLLSPENYERAKEYLAPLAEKVEKEDVYTRHIGMFIKGWEVELHGNLRSGISSRIDKGIDDITRDVFNGENVRSWMNYSTQVFLMGVDNDIFYVFTHILQHFYKGGIGLRQICDWCRLLWKYNDSINVDLLEKRLNNSGIMSEWTAFASLAVNCLGMPKETMPFYNSSEKWRRKACKILSIVFETGNFGHNIDESYRRNYSGFQKRAISAFRYTIDGMKHFMIFPMNSVNAWWNTMRTGFQTAIN